MNQQPTLKKTKSNLGTYLEVLLVRSWTANLELWGFCRASATTSLHKDEVCMREQSRRSSNAQQKRRQLLAFFLSFEAMPRSWFCSHASWPLSRVPCLSLAPSLTLLRLQAQWGQFHLEVQCNLDLVTLLVSTKTVTKSRNVTKSNDFM